MNEPEPASPSTSSPKLPHTQLLAERIARIAPFRFTPETARANSIKGHRTRHLAYLHKRALEDAQIAQANNSSAADDYRAQALVKLRERALIALERSNNSPTPAQAVSWLRVADLAAKQEARLAGRPLQPGSTDPSQRSSGRTSTAGEPAPLIPPHDDGPAEQPAA